MAPPRAGALRLLLALTLAGFAATAQAQAQAQRDRVWGVVLDDMDVPSVVRYRVRAGP